MYNDWLKRWKSALAACERLGGSVDELEVGEPATEEEIAAVEAQLGQRLPASFRKVLLEFASKVKFFWQLPDDAEAPEALEAIFAADGCWDLEFLVQAEEDRQSWIDNCFSNPEDEYDQVWHNKLAFYSVANGDSITFDLSMQGDPPVVYLSHEDGELHGFRLGNNFIDFIDKWTQLGCPGLEDWQLEPFIESETSTIDPNGENARVWKEWFGIR